MMKKDSPYYKTWGWWYTTDFFSSSIKIKVFTVCVSDDGKLSFDEFNAYFADGILTTEELQELFLSIDNRQNKWVHFIWSFW